MTHARTNNTRKVQHTNAHLGRWSWMKQNVEEDEQAHVVREGLHHWSAVNLWPEMERGVDAGDSVWLTQADIGRIVPQQIEAIEQVGETRFDSHAVSRLLKCKLHAGGETKKYVVKMPWYEPEEGLGSTRHGMDTAFAKEMYNFERIYEPQAYYTRFGRGQRANRITVHQYGHPNDYEAMLRQEQQLKQQEGRRHIHKYKHLEDSIPILLTEWCEGNLTTLLMTHAELFGIEEDHVGIYPTWDLLVEHIASAMHFMRNRGFAHTDINTDNIVYCLDKRDRSFIFKLTNFQNILPALNQANALAHAPFFAPPHWPQDDSRIIQPITFSLYTFAATMAWVLFSEANVPGERSFMHKIERLRATHELGALYFPRNPPPTRGLWWRILDILNLNYAQEATRDRSDLLAQIMRECQPPTYRNSLLESLVPGALPSVLPAASRESAPPHKKKGK